MPQVVAIVLLGIALNPSTPYEYYIFLRCVLCGIFAYLAYWSAAQKKEGWTWTLGITAVAYNPIIPIHATRDFWSVVNLATIIIAASSIVVLKK